jgi:peptide-methionine (S)-S-oxide reductase
VFTRSFLIGVIMCAAYAAAAETLPKPTVDLPADKSGNPATAVLAGGCFWCTEAVIKQIDGVIAVESGYAGGTATDADYETVSTGRTGHAEAIKITYEPKKITYGELLQILFTAIDPTQKDAQGPDIGRQYRSAIFFASEDQKAVAQAYIKQLDDAKIYSEPVVTTLEPLTGFFPAERYHQNYVELHPNQPYVQQCSLPKVRKIREIFKNRLKSTTQPTAKN